jgi:hypothetical protein
VLVNADTTTHPELFNARFAYVSVSRARLDAEIYTNNAEGLGPRLSADLGKSSAIEFSQSVGIPPQEISGSARAFERLPGC